MANRFVPVGADSSLEDLIRVSNANFSQLDGESVVKTFSGPNGRPALTQGRLLHGFYGTAYTDQSGKVVKLIGFDKNGKFIELTVKDGADAYSVLGY